MCGILGAISKRNVAEILLTGLKRLEYRGYDSAGIAILGKDHTIQRHRATGKVIKLVKLVHQTTLPGTVGIAHTRWATHGKPATHNAHPILSSDNNIAVVHNGIIENHAQLRQELQQLGYEFTSETDTETVVHLLHYHQQQTDDWLTAIRQTINRLEGAYALGIINQTHPDLLVAIRQGSPLIIGLGIEENFLASDSVALLPVTQQFMYLEEGDVALIRTHQVDIMDVNGATMTRSIHEISENSDAVSKGSYRHFMQKEIFEQATVVTHILDGRISQESILEEALGSVALDVFDQVKAVQIVACGTSYHAGLIAKHWLEAIAGIPCQVDVASEIRYRNPVILPNTLLVTISQSGETADTLAALQQAKQQNYLATLAICNVAQSSLVREADIALMTRAGTEIGVASTKAFTAQLTILLLLSIALGRRHALQPATEQHLVTQLHALPDLMTQALDLDPTIKQLAQLFADKQHALFLGRNLQYPLALEGALKLKEISYIHAEAYPAGELKHGPLALVDKHMPVITVAPNDQLLTKLTSNLQEVRARGGELFVFTDSAIHLEQTPDTHIIKLPTVDHILAPIVYVIPLQLLAYHVAVCKGTDVDQPRNLAKSVTVE